MSRARLLRAVVVLIVDAACLLVLSAILPNFSLDRPAAAVTAAIVVGALNAVVWPLLARFTLPLSVLTLGIGTLILNGALVAFAIDLVPGASIDDFWTGVVVALGLTLLTTVLASLLALDEDDSWYRNVVRRQARRRGDRTETDVPGVIFLEIDGLAHDVRCGTETPRRSRAGCARARTGSSAGRPTGRRRRAPARRGCSTATTTTCRPSAGGRRTAARRS